MSGELLLREPYMGDTSGPTPLHQFQHDLESIFWILLWIFLCKSGAGVRRPALTDKAHRDHERLARTVGLLFEAENIYQLGHNKEIIILYAMQFDRCLALVDDFYAPLTPLLKKLWSILNAGYVAGHFEFGTTMDQFTAAFDEAEQLLEQNPHILTAEQETNVRAEELRRAEDDDDWEHTPRPEVKLKRPAGLVLEPLQALQLSRPDIPDEPAGLSVEDLEDEDSNSGVSRQGSPTPFAHAADSDTLALGSKPRATRSAKPNAAKATTSTKPPPAHKKKASTAAPSKSGPASSDRPLRSRSRATTARSESIAAGSSRATSPPSSRSSQSTVQERSDSRAHRRAQDDHVAGPSTGDRGGRGGRGAGFRGRGGQRGRGTSKRNVSGNATKTKKKKQSLRGAVPCRISDDAVVPRHLPES